jgi:large subunit ribosomal protein L3
MAGHMGSEQVTTQGLEIVQVDQERNLVLIKGSVPGSRDGFLIIRRSRKGK